LFDFGYNLIYLFTGTVVCLRTILIADTLGIDQLTQAFGIIAFFQGLAFTINPPIAGKVRINAYSSGAPEFTPGF